MFRCPWRKKFAPYILIFHHKYKYYYQNYYGKDVNPKAIQADQPMKEEVEEAPVVEPQEEKKEN